MRARFFVTGHGRSGTTWLAHLLNACDPTLDVSHEPLSGYDRGRYHKVFHGRLSGYDYVTGRRPLMEQIAGERDWAEVNSYLRYVVTPLRETFHAPVAAIIRDGRYVVRSMLALGVYGRPGYPEIETPDHLETAFDKCCWYWAETYRIMERLIVPVYRLEDLNRDYETLCGLCEYLNMEPDREAWRRYADKPINVGVGESEPPEWGALSQRFRELAGEIQDQFYDDLG